MITLRQGWTVLLPAAILAVVACDAGEPSRTAADFAADSALAADLAMINRGTAIVDSIGPSGDAPADTAVATVTPAPPVRAVPPAQPAPTPTRTPTRTPTSAPAPARVTTPAPAAPAVTAPSPAAPRLTGTRACTSATTANQQECLRALLASEDARLNRIYRALITEMRRQERVAPGARDPRSVERLRAEQRAWLDQRDATCRERGRGSEGRLWARPRASCLGELADQRASVLANRFSELTSR